LEGQKLIKIYAKLKRRSDISYISERNWIHKDRNLPEKIAYPEKFIGKFYQMFKEKLTPVLNNFRKLRRQEHLPTHSMKTTLSNNKARQQYYKKTDQYLSLIYT
jgi:hypothetical protein